MSMMNVDALAKMPVHDTAALFPMMDESNGKELGALSQLASDLKANGCHTPVVTYKGTILDGRNRLAAARLVGIEFLPTTEYEGADPLSYVLSLNLHRRQLTKAQLVELAMKLWPQVEAKAATRSGNQYTAVDGNISNEQKIVTRDEVAKMLGGAVSGKLIEQGRAVMEKAPQVWKEVQSGARSISDAYGTVKAPPAYNPTLDAEKLLDKADRAYDNFIDVVVEMRKVGNDEQKLRLVKQANHLLEEALKYGTAN